MSFWRRLFKRQTTPTPFPVEWRTNLLETVPFYEHLNAEERASFESRMMEFLDTTQITGVKTHVDDVDKMLLAASAIIPIFAFPNWKYHNLHEILLYPAHFDEQFGIGSKEKAILGMVGYGYMDGKMIISKKSLHHGFTNETDKRNTAIHEFVHLLDKSDGKVDGIPVHFMQEPAVLPWLNLMDENIHKILKKKSDINPYGATNRAEFLAVASEYFFERPHLFKKKHPELYEMLSDFFSVEHTHRAEDVKSQATRHFDPCPCGSGEKFRDCCMKN